MIVRRALTDTSVSRDALTVELVDDDTIVFMEGHQATLAHSRTGYGESRKVTISELELVEENVRNAEASRRNK